MKEYGFLNSVLLEIIGFELSESDWHKDFYTVGLDSLDVVEWIMAVEAKLQISIPDETIELWETPHQFALYMTRINNKPASV